MIVTKIPYRILEHQRQALAEKTQYMADGEEIRRLAREAEARQKQLLEDQVNDRKLTKKDLLEDIELRKRLRLVDKIKEEVSGLNLKSVYRTKIKHLLTDQYYHAL